MTPEDDGNTLVLRGLNLGKLAQMPPQSVWRAARDEHFPRASMIRFERRTNGRARWVSLPLQPTN